MTSDCNMMKKITIVNMELLLVIKKLHKQDQRQSEK